MSAKVANNSTQTSEVSEVSEVSEIIKLKSAIETNNRNLITANATSKNIDTKIIEVESKLSEIHKLLESQAQIIEMQKELNSVNKKVTSLEKNLKIALESIHTNNINRFEEVIQQNKTLKGLFLEVCYLRLGKVRKVNLLYLLLILIISHIICIFVFIFMR